MRFASTLALFMIPAVFGAPIPRPGFFDDVGKAITDLKNNGATLGGIGAAVGDSIKRPGLLIARIQVVKGLGSTSKDLDGIVAAADKTQNTAVSDSAKTAKEGVKAAQGAVSSIGKAIFSGATPERNDQAVVAAGIKKAQDAIAGLEKAIVTKDADLSKLIASAVKDIALARKGGEGVLAANDLTFEDVGLPANPDAPAAADPAADKATADKKVVVDAPPAEAPPAEVPAEDALVEDAAPVDDAAPADEEITEEDAADEAEVADQIQQALEDEAGAVEGRDVLLPEQRATVPNEPIPA